MAFGFFDPQKGQSATGIAQSRAMAAALLRSGGAPKNVGEGLNSIGDAIFYRSLIGDADASEKAGTDAFTSQFNSLIAPYSGGGQAASIPMPTAAGEVAATAPGSVSSTGVLPGSLLAALDKTEGGGGYDTLFGNAQRKGPFAGTDVSKMSIADVLAFQDPNGPYAQTVKGQVGRVATPVGRHQIVGTTLRNAVGALGLDPSQPFDPATQDQVALYLAKNRVNASDNLAGQMAGLRSEWEGFRNIPDSQLAQIIGDLKGGVQTAPVGNVEVASLAAPQTATDAINTASPQPGYRDPQVTTAYANPAPTTAAPPLPAPTTVAAAPAVAEAAPLAAPQQVAQNFQPQQIDPRLIEAANSPFATPGQKAILGGIIQQQQQRNELILRQQMQQADPSYQIGLEKSQIELNRLKNPGEPADIQELRIRAKEAGIEPGTPEYQALFASGGKSPLVTVNNGDNSGAFAKKSDEEAATRLGSIVSEGNAAPQLIGDLQQLAELGKQIGTGKGAQVTAAIGPYAQALGIDVKGLDESQAFTAIVNRLAPQMRPVGAGATSDFDARQFLSSLPSLGNQPGGNELISQTFQAVQQNKLAAAEIASKAQTGEIKWQEAERQIRALPNPYEVFKSNREKLGQASENPLPPTPSPQGQRPRATNPQTGAVIEFDGKGWVPVQ